MRTVFLALFVLYLTAGLVGCGDNEPVAPSATAIGIDKNPPAQSGPRVVRYEDVGYFFMSDPVSQLTVIVGLDAREFCDEGIFDPAVWEIQDVTNPQDQNVVNSLLRGQEIPVWVWPYFNGYCYEIEGVEPIAWGTCNLVNTDNDFYAWLNDQNRVNSYGWVATGRLESADGPVHLNAVFRAVWPGGSDPEWFRYAVEKVNLR